MAKLRLFDRVTLALVGGGVLFGGSFGIVFSLVLFAEDFENFALVAELLIMALSAITGGCIVAVIVFRNKLLDARAGFGRASAMNLSKDNFISMVLHHLRTPLSGTRWLLQDLIRHYDERQGILEDLQTLAKENALMLDAVVHLLDALRASTERFDLDLSILSVDDVINHIEKAVHAYHSALAQKNISFALKREEKHIGYVRIDIQKIQIIVQTLLENAISYTPNNGSVEIAMYLEGDNLIYRITDSGIGMDDDTKGRIFQEFYRGSNAKKADPKGFGIGLFLVKTFVKRHQGTIEVDSVLGKGSTFRVKIPLYYSEHETKLETSSKIATNEA